MGTFEAISAWIQIGLLLAMLLLAQRFAAQFGGFSAWRVIWIAFAVGFVGMLATRIFVLLYAYGIEAPWMRFCSRFLVPLQASIGLFVGMWLLARILHQVQPLHALIHLPHPAGFILDREGRIMAWDAGAEALFGCTADEAIGTTLMELITPPHTLNTHVPIVERYLRTGTPHGQSQRYPITARSCNTHEEFAVEVILTAEANSHGAIRFKGISRKLMPSI